MDHFFELEQGDTNKWHHQKWIIFSIHHAASCLSNSWLMEADPLSKVFKTKNGKEAFPHLIDSTKELSRFKGTKKLTLAEGKLLLMFGRLNDIRNKFMHRTPPKEIDKALIAFTSISMVGMYHTMARRKGSTFKKLFDEFPENRQPIVRAIHSSKLPEYVSFIEAFMPEAYPNKFIQSCPLCSGNAVVGSHCETCFEDFEETTCSHCGEEILVPSFVVKGDWTCLICKGKT